MNALSDRIDAYFHLGLPRFVSLEETIQVMDANGIDRAVVAGADTCPDLPEISRAVVEYPDRFRAVGVPLGNSLDEIETAICHQADCGFLGIRIFDRMIAENPSLLKLMGDRAMIPYVVGGPALAPAAQLLVDFLEGGSDRWAVAPHFAGATDPGLLELPGPVRDLFQHPRFLVIFSRHGAYDPQVVRPWAEKLVSFLGWERILFGSEFPVCLWRNESYRSTLDWAKSLDVDFSPDQQTGFYGENARQAIWDRPLLSAKIVDDRYSPRRWPTPTTVPLFTSQGIELPTALHRRFIENYLAGEQENYPDYRDYLTQVLAAIVEDFMDNVD